MRGEWYRDKRDIVKWTSVLYLAKRQKVKCILYVAMCPSQETRIPKLSTNGCDVSDAEQYFDQVIGHFRVEDWTNDLKSFGSSQGIEVEVVGGEYSAKNGTSYFKEVCEKIKVFEEKYRKSPILVFLDPDTGIEPQKAKREHVKKRDLKIVFDKLRPGDYLVCYQHRPQSVSSIDRKWQKEAEKRMACAVGVNKSRVEFFESDYDSELTILAVKKPNKQESASKC